MILIIIVGIILLDQFVKYAVVSGMELGQSFNLIPGLINVTYVTNRGAAFGILKDHRWVFIIISAVAITAMCVFLQSMLKHKGHVFAKISLALIIGGGAGNMIDRLTTGEVVDFIELAFVRFAIFNIADSFVCVGSVLFCLALFVGGTDFAEHFSIKKTTTDDYSSVFEKDIGDNKTPEQMDVPKADDTNG